MPGVKAILTADEVPGPKDQVNDAGQVIKANLKSEMALTNEPLYQGEPVLAVAAIDELTAAEAIEKIRIRWSRCRSVWIQWRRCSRARRIPAWETFGSVRRGRRVASRRRFRRFRI